MLGLSCIFMTISRCQKVHCRFRADAYSSKLVTISCCVRSKKSNKSPSFQPRKMLETITQRFEAAPPVRERYIVSGVGGLTSAYFFFFFFSFLPFFNINIYGTLIIGN